MDLLDLMLRWAPPLGTLASMGFAASIWAMRREFASRGDLMELERRTDLIERDIEHLPRHDHLDEVKAELGRLNASLQATSAQLQTLGNSMRRVEDYLLNRKSA